MTKKPWQVTIDVNPKDGSLWFRVREHYRGSIAFSDSAVEICGGAAETDDDGYAVRCNQEPRIVEVAREIARLSELP